MASIQIPNLTAAISVSGAEQMEAVQSGSSVRVTIQQIADLAGSQYGLTPIPDLTLLGNLSGVSALPTSYTLSQFLDSSFSNTQGAVIYRGPSSWQALAPGANGQVLRTNGTGADVSWYTVPGGGTVQSITAGTNLSVSGSANPITLAGTIDTVMNPAFTTSVTTPSIYGGSSASETLLIQSTTGVGTSDSIVFKVGNNGAITAMTIASDGTVTIPQAAIDTTSITVPLLIGGTTASSSLTLQSTSGVGTTDSILMKVGNNGAITALSVASSGIVTIGTLNLTNALSVLYGGTGATTFTTNGVLYGNATSAVGVTAAGTTGQVLVATTGSAPTWSSTIPSTAGVTSISFDTTGLTPSTATTGAITVAGTLVAANGGTGQSSYTIGDLLYASGATALSKLADVAVGSVLVSGGVGTAPAYSSSPSLTTSLTVPIVYGGTTASSSLTLQSTSGAGTTDSIIFKVGNAGAVTALTIGTTGEATFGVSATSPYYIANGATTGSRDQGAYAYGTMSYSDTNVLLSLQSSVNTYNELIIQNTNSGTTASTNIIVSNDLGTASTYFGEFGMNSSGFTGTGSLAGASNVYLTSTSSDLAIGTTTANAIRFVVNSGTTDALLIRSDGNTSIGGAGAASTSLYLQKDLSVATSYGVFQSGQFQSGVTNGYSFNSSANVATGATLTAFTHFRATEGTISGTITTQTGFDAVSDLISATTNYGFRAQSTAAVGAGKTAYGFYSAVNTATGGGTTWGFYGAGTANNYMAGNLGIGSTSLTSTNLAIGANITGGTTAYAQLNSGVIQSGVTSIGGSFVSNMSSAAAAFTTTSAVHFWANPNAGGASSTITNQYGFLASSTLGTQGGATVTNAYGFYGDIASATNRWNLYMGGTANNYFAGYSFGLGGVQYTTTSTATNTATLTATQVASGFIVGTPTATASYTLPTVANLETELGNVATGYNFEFVVFTTAAFAITLLTATGWTLVGSMATGATANSSARFRARKTGASTWSLYRV